MTAQSSPSIDRTVLEEAAHWLLRLREAQITPEHISEWLDWCARDPSHRLAFERMQDLWEMGDGATGLQEESHRMLKVRARNRSRPWQWVAAAAVLLAIGIAGIGAWHGSAMDFSSQLQTQRGKPENFILPDGSQISLGGQSQVTMEYDRGARRAMLGEGEAFFSVHGNRNRPFIVAAGPLTITAIGTAFNVRRDAGSVLVTVAEGVVDVRARNALATDTAEGLDMRAQSGHQVRYQDGRVSSMVERVDPAIASSFKQGKLQYVDEPLRLVIASINRYATEPIRLADPAIGDLRFTGTVFQDNIDDWLQGLDAVFPVRVTRKEGTIFISHF